MQTDEYKSIITEYNTHLEQRLNVKYEELTEKITDVNEWNMLSLDDFDNTFYDDVNKVIDKKTLPHIEYVKHSPESYDNYLNMEIGLPGVEYGDLHFSVAKIS